MRPTFAARLFVQHNQHSRLPAPQHLQALLMEEEAAAVLYLEESSKSTSPLTNITVETATIYSNNAHLHAEIIHSNQKGNDGEEVPQKVYFFTVEKWSDLAIGIDEAWKYWAITPAPQPGQQFPMGKAKELPLNGKQWRCQGTEQSIVKCRRATRTLRIPSPLPVSKRRQNIPVWRPNTFLERWLATVSHRRIDNFSFRESLSRAPMF